MKSRTAIVVAMVGALMLSTGGALWGENLTLGDYTYTTNAAGQATITGFNKNYTGALAITNSLGGCPVTSIDRSAFQACTNLTSITIPASVTSIDRQAFAGCTNLTSITVDTANPNYSSLDGVLFNKEQTRLIKYPADKTGNYVIPNTVIWIPDEAFRDCTGLTSVRIPNGVTRINSDLFRGCTSLTNITISANVISIGKMGVFSHAGLTAITVDAANPNYSSLDGILFNKDLSTLIQFPNGKAGKFEIPVSVTNIEFSAWGWGFNSLNAITVDAVNSNYSGLGGVLFNKSQTTLIRCPGSKAGDYAIPASVSNIKSLAFLSCKNLTSVTIPASVTNIGEYAFSGCVGLTNITILANVTSIGNGAFYGCVGLTNIIIPASVTSIGNGAFYGCVGLTNIIIPASVTSIGWGAFKGCESLKAIKVDAANTNYTCLDGVVFDKGQTTLILYPTGKTGSYAIPASVTCIGYAAFYGCTGLTNITIPKSVTNIGAGAFNGCARLTEITIPASVTTIGNQAFSGCTGLTNISIPASVNDIGERVFSGCTNLPTAIQNLAPKGPASTVIPGVIRPGVIRPLSATVPLTLGDYTYTTNAAGQATITDFNKNYTGALAITNTLGGCPVTSIGGRAFLSCTGMTVVTISDGITSLGTEALRDCSGLSSVTIPASVSSIKVDWFSGCSSLTGIAVNTNNTAYSSVDGVLFNKSQTMLVLFPKGKTGIYAISDNVTSIGEFAFLSCTGLTNVTIPANVTSIGTGAFYGCTGLTDLAIPANITSIGNFTFQGCIGLTNISIPASVTSVGDYAFYGCARLINITIPASVTGIGQATFFGCTGLTNITIPAGVTSIRQQAFAGCTGLINIIIPASVTNFGFDAFLGCTNLPPAIQDLAPKRPVIPGVIRAPRSPVPSGVPDVATPTIVNTNPTTPASPVPPIPAISLANTNVLEIPAASYAGADFMKLLDENAAALGIVCISRMFKSERQIDSLMELVIHYTVASLTSNAVSKFAAAMHQSGAEVAGNMTWNTGNGTIRADLTFTFHYRRTGTPPVALPPPPPQPTQTGTTAQKQ